MSALQQPLMQPIQKKTFNKAEETRSFLLGKVDLLTLAGVTFGRAVFQPGWKWSTCIKPIAKTESCESSHLAVHISGRLHVVMDDGTEVEYGPGDVGLIPPGHDAWVVGDEPVVLVDITGMGGYGRP